MRETTVVSPLYLRAALKAWEYFDEHGPYMRASFRDAVERRGHIFTDKKEAAMIGLLYRIADGEAFTMPDPLPRGSVSDKDAGILALRDVTALALRAVPGAWEEWEVNEGKG